MGERRKIRKLAFRLEKQLGECNPISRHLELLADRQTP